MNKISFGVEIFSHEVGTPWPGSQGIGLPSGGAWVRIPLRSDDTVTPLFATGLH